MSLISALYVAAHGAPASSFENVRERLPVEWIEEALEATGVATLRRRRLPAEQVIWLVLGMALMRDRSIEEVVSKLDLALPSAEGTVARSAPTQARARLGTEPIRWLFERSAKSWTEQHDEKNKWHGLVLYGIDGTTLRVADTPQNEAEFGRAQSVRGASGYPMVRMVAAMALRSRLLAAVDFGPYGSGELTYSLKVRDAIPNHSLTVVDRAYFSATWLLGLRGAGSERHWLTRAKSKLRWTVARIFSDHDALVEMKVSAEARSKDAQLPATWRMRAITYKRGHHAPQVLLTSLLDPVRYPADELIELYHERWELELAYDELKTDMFDQQPTLRSKSPAMVRQELWAALLMYNLIRLEMAAVAKVLAVPPSRISFVASFHLIRDEWLWDAVAKPGAIPRHLTRLRESLKRYLLPPRKADRSYPRAVKIKMSNYPRKRPITSAN
ncbi:MAG: IS4 family transposase [Polyangiaceae bacterium]